MVYVGVIEPYFLAYSFTVILAIFFGKLKKIRKTSGSDYQSLAGAKHNLWGTQFNWQEKKFHSVPLQAGSHEAAYL
mgnify:CR=1 FL=1